MGKPVNSRSKEQPPEGPAAGQSVTGPVDKAMEVLSALVETGAPHRLADLSRRTNLAKPTVHRLLRGLAGSGWAEPAEGGSYRAGPRLLGLAAAALDDDAALRLARPALAELRARTGLFAHYWVRDADSVVCLGASQAPREFPLDLRPGLRLPLLGSAPGLAMLAAGPDGATDKLPGAVRGEDPLTATYGTEDQAPVLGDGTDPGEEHGCPLPPAALRRALDAAAKDGFALDDQYTRDDTRALASAVCDADGRVVGALALSGLLFTLDADSVELYGPMVRAAARSVSAGLGAGARPRLVGVARDAPRSAER